MRSQVRTGIIAIAVTSVLAACASTGPASPPSQMTSASPAGTTSASPSAPATAAAAPKKAGGSPADSYKRVVKKNGQEYFCRKEGVTGSRTQVIETCLTQAQLATLRESSQEFARDVQGSLRDPGADPQQVRTLDSNYSGAQ